MSDEALRRIEAKLDEAIADGRARDGRQDQRLDAVARSVTSLEGRMTEQEAALTRTRDTATNAVSKTTESLHEVQSERLAMMAHLQRAEEARLSATARATDERRTAQAEHARSFANQGKAIAGLQQAVKAGIDVRLSGAQKMAIVVAIIASLGSCLATAEHAFDRYITARYPAPAFDAGR